MPIYGLTESVRIPRLGKIHLGIKKTNANGKEYPVATDYFVCDDPTFTAVYGEKPRTLDVRFPLEDPSTFSSQFYKSYTRGRGLVCKGDGKNCTRMVYVDAMAKSSDHTPAGRDETGKRQTVWIEMICDGQECPIYKANKCSELMMLQFMLPKVEGFGIWQIDTGSINSILNINNAVRLIQGIGGRVRMVPLKLSIVPQEVVAEGRKKTVYVLRLDIAVKLEELMAAGGTLALGEAQKELEADKEPPEDVDSETGEMCQATEPPSEEEIADGKEQAKYLDDGPPVETEPEPTKTLEDYVDAGLSPADKPQPKPSQWPPFKPFTEVPKVGAVVASRQQLVQWITKREQDCEANALTYPALDAEADDLALANHWAQLKAILEAPR
jgi:hypothetical protein